MNEEDEEPVVPVLCDECSAKMTSDANWLGVGKLDAFDCMICRSLCCSHLREPGRIAICLDCA